MGGPACPQIPRLAYWTNDLLKVSGEEHMVLVHLRSKTKHAAPTTRCICKKCFSTLLVDFPLFEGNCVAVYEDVVKQDTSFEDVQARLFCDDYDAAVRGELPILSADVPSNGKFPVKKKQRIPSVNPFVDAPSSFGFTVQSLFTRLGDPVVLELIEGQHYGPSDVVRFKEMPCFNAHL